MPKKKPIPIEIGTFCESIPYVKAGSGEQKVVYFPGSSDLLFGTFNEPHTFVNLFFKALPPSTTLYILCYPPNLAPNTSPEMIADQFAMAVKQYIGKALVVGASYGGHVAFPFAAKYPELVDRLLILMSAYAFSENGMKFIDKVIHTAENCDKCHVRWVFDGLYNIPVVRGMTRVMTKIKYPSRKEKYNPISAVLNAYRYIQDHNGELRRFLPQIKAQTYIVGGDKDIVFSEELFRESAHLIPNSEFIFFPGKGHMIPFEAVGIFIKEMRARL